MTQSASISQRQPIKNRWALLVGVNRYIDPSFPRLNFCVNDVLALEQTLKGLGYTVVCLHDRLDSSSPRFPTRVNVEEELTRLCEMVEPDDLLMVHFACHGKLLNGEPVLIAHDTRARTMAKTALQLAFVKQQIRQSKAKRLVLTLDACHTGVEIGRGITDPEFIRNSYELAEGFVLIAASTAQQIAQEWGEKEHGVFTYYLLEGLSGKADRSNKGFVTVDDLKTHVLHGLRRWMVEHGGVIQEPTVQTEGLGDMILADYRSLVQTPNNSVTVVNPFGDRGRIADPKRFFNREELLRQIFEELSKRSNLSLVGETQIGKSSILEMIRHWGPERLQLPPEAFIYLDMQIIHNENEFFEALCDELKMDNCRGYKLARNLRDKRHILCLDEIEKMTSKEDFTWKVRSELRGLAGDPNSPLSLVIASRSPLKDLFDDCSNETSPLASICNQLDVKPFTFETVRSFITQSLRGTGIMFTENQIQDLFAKSKGHPQRLQVAAYELFRKAIQRDS